MLGFMGIGILEYMGVKILEYLGIGILEYILVFSVPFVIFWFPRVPRMSSEFKVLFFHYMFFYDIMASIGWILRYLGIGILEWCRS